MEVFDDTFFPPGLSDVWAAVRHCQQSDPALTCRDITPTHARPTCPGGHHEHVVGDVETLGHEIDAGQVKVWGTRRGVETRDCRLAHQSRRSDRAPRAPGLTRQQAGPAPVHGKAPLKLALATCRSVRRMTPTSRDTKERWGGAAFGALRRTRRRSIQAMWR
jgi:hypothetical protein